MIGVVEMDWKKTRDEVQKWAGKNGLTLIFLSLCFFITWIIQVVSVYVW